MRWPAKRCAAVQALFGDGMMTPGGDAALAKLLEPIELTAGMKVLDLGSGLGGVARAFACATRGAVTGYESEAELAAEANRLTARLNLSGKVAVKCAPLAEVPVQPASVHVVVAKEVLFAVPQKQVLFSRMRQALRAGGQFSLTDFVRGSDANTAALQVWAAHEPSPPFLIMADDLRGALQTAGFEVCVMEDISADFKRWTLDAFALCAKAIDDRRIDRDLIPWVVNEGEHWSRRLDRLAANDLKVVRCYARVLPQKR